MRNKSIDGHVGEDPGVLGIREANEVQPAVGGRVVSNVESLTRIFSYSLRCNILWGEEKQGRHCYSGVFGNKCLFLNGRSARMLVE